MTTFTQNHAGLTAITSRGSHLLERSEEEALPDLSPIHTTEYVDGQVIKIPFERTTYYSELLASVSDQVAALTSTLISDEATRTTAIRYIKCQSNRVSILMARPSLMESLGFENTVVGRIDFYAHYSQLNNTEKAALGDGITRVKLTCDNKFCDDPCCIAHRNKKVIDTYKPVLELLYDHNPHARLNLRGLELTSDLKPTPENLTIFQEKVKSFFKLNQIKRYVFAYIAAFHIHQSRIHAHIIAWTLWLPAEHLTSAWNNHTGWTDTNIKQIRGGLKSHLGHLCKYIAKPFVLKENPDNAIELIKAFHKRRLLTAAGIKNALKRHKHIQDHEYIRVGPEFIHSLISIKRNNCYSSSCTPVTEYVFEDENEARLIALEHLDGGGG